MLRGAVIVHGPMKQFSNEIGIVQIDGSSLDEDAARRLAWQISQFMVGVQRYYIEDLGLERIDPDPPPGDPGDIDWRLSGLQRSGAVEENGLAFIGAFALRPDGSVSEEPDALQGMLILSKPDGNCTDSHSATEILEWDVAAGLRGTGLGRRLLQEGLATVHPEDGLILDVAENNLAAQGIYRRYGFVPATDVAPMEHGIFAVRHVQMGMPASALQERLQIAPHSVDSGTSASSPGGDETMPTIVNRIIETLE